MISPFINACILIAVFSLANFAAQLQPNSFSIKKVFHKDAVLTPEQVDTVVLLGRQCGLSRPRELQTTHSSQYNTHMIVLLGNDTVDGNRTSTDIVLFECAEWGKVIPSKGAKNLGSFWVQPPLLQTLHFAEVRVQSNLFRVQMPTTISIATAETIFSAFAKRELGEPLVDESIGGGFRGIEQWKPERLDYNPQSGEYSVCFTTSDGMRGANVKLNGVKVVLTGGPSKRYY